MRYGGASKQTGLTGRLEHLVSKPVAVYEAACEEFGDICRKSWLIGHRGVLRRCRNGSNWWQRMLVELSNLEDPVWDEALVDLLKNPRAAPLTPADERAGRFRFSADALARVKAALRSDTEDQDASGYAWLLWNASAKTGLQIGDLCAARAVDGKLVKETGELLLRALSLAALSACERLIAYSKD